MQEMKKIGDGKEKKGERESERKKTETEGEAKLKQYWASPARVVLSKVKNTASWTEALDAKTREVADDQDFCEGGATGEGQEKIDTY